MMWDTQGNSGGYLHERIGYLRRANPPPIRQKMQQSSVCGGPGRWVDVVIAGAGCGVGWGLSERTHGDPGIGRPGRTAARRRLNPNGGAVLPARE